MASKRPFDRNPKDQNGGRRKVQKTAPSDRSTGGIVYRLLCHTSKFGGLVGKGGSVVSRIRQDTGARIQIEDIVPGCEERIVVITASEKKGPAGGAEGRNAAGDDEIKISGEGAAAPGAELDNEGKEAPSSAGKGLISAQRALLLVTEKIASSVRAGPAADGGDAPVRDSERVSVRMLIHSRQVGCIMGKAGSVIKQIHAESGADLVIIPRDKVPICAAPGDDTLQITGSMDEVKNALQTVSQRLLDNQPRETGMMAETASLNKPSGPSNFPFAPFPIPGEVMPPINLHHGFPRPPFPPRLGDNPDFLGPPIPKFPEGVNPGRLPITPLPVTYRMVCLNEKVRNVIGKGGSTIKKMQHDSGCEIRVADAPPDMRDRVIIITGPALPDDGMSPPQDAVFRVLEKIAMPAPDGQDNTILVRIMISTGQTGCLLGKGGNIISEMRKTSGANIRILSKDQLPKCATDNDEAVQICGDFDKVREALFQITTRLKHHYFHNKFPALNHPAHPPFMDQGPPFPPPFMGRREPSPPGPLSSFDSSFRKFGPTGGLQEERPFGLPPARGEKFPPAPWSAPGLGDGVGPMSMHDFPGPPQRMGGFSGGSQQPVITNTTVDVVVPRSVVPSIYGEDGDSLKQIRQISGANITIKDAEPGATETVIIISGAPDQTHAAQSLIQAFVLSETETN